MIQIVDFCTGKQHRFSSASLDDNSLVLSDLIVFEALLWSDPTLFRGTACSNLANTLDVFIDRFSCSQNIDRGIIACFHLRLLLSLILLSASMLSQLLRKKAAVC